MIKKENINDIATCIRCGETKAQSTNFYVQRDRHGNSRYAAKCKQCVSNMGKNYYQRHKEYIKAKTIKDLQPLIDWYKNYKSNLECKQCGYNDDISRLHFHHTDPNNKIMEVSELVRRGNKQRVLDEIEKCIVLCADCHIQEHNNR